MDGFITLTVLFFSISNVTLNLIFVGGVSIYVVFCSANVVFLKFSRNICARAYMGVYVCVQCDVAWCRLL